MGNRRAEVIGKNLIGEFNLERGRYDEVETPLNDSFTLTDALGFFPFKAYLLMQLGRLRVAQGRAEDARKIVDEAMMICRETGERFIAPRVLGVGALAAQDDVGRMKCLNLGEEILSRGCNAHNHLWFYRDAIEASLMLRNWIEVERYAQTMTDYTQAEPLPWSEFHIARARVLASFGRGERSAVIAAELDRLRGEGERIGFAPQLAAVNAALAEIGESP